MASSTLIKLVRRKSLSKYAGDIMDKEMLKEFRGPMAKAISGAYERIVKDWSGESKPRFVVRAGKSSAGRYFWNVRVEPPGSIKAQRWLMVDTEGREGGVTIKPKRQYGVLRFKYYFPKTLPYTHNSRFAVKIPSSGPPRVAIGGGRGIGDKIFTRQVEQGKVEPRQFTEKVIKPAAEEEFKLAGRRAYDRARRAIRRGG